MKIQISPELLAPIDFTELKKQYPWNDQNNPNDYLGQDFHRLYAYISTLFNGIKIADLGSRVGSSALSLSYNPTNHVKSYEVHEPYHLICKQHIVKHNIEFCFGDILTAPDILQFDLISLDVDPHDGQKERNCLAYLKANNWKGIVLLDDILWNEMKNFWHEIDLPKWDITSFGHFSGTGLVDFTGSLEVELLNVDNFVRQYETSDMKYWRGVLGI